MVVVLVGSVAMMRATAEQLDWSPAGEAAIKAVDVASFVEDGFVLLPGFLPPAFVRPLADSLVSLPCLSDASLRAPAFKSLARYFVVISFFSFVLVFSSIHRSFIQKYALATC